MGGRKVNLDTLEYLLQNLGGKTKGMKTKSCYNYTKQWQSKIEQSTWLKKQDPKPGGKTELGR